MDALNGSTCCNNIDSRVTLLSMVIIRLVSRMCRVPAYDINCREVVDATYALRVDTSLFPKLETLMIHMT